MYDNDYNDLGIFKPSLNLLNVCFYFVKYRRAIFHGKNDGNAGGYYTHNNNCIYKYGSIECFKGYYIVYKVECACSSYATYHDDGYSIFYTIFKD